MFEKLKNKTYLSLKFLTMLVLVIIILTLPNFLYKIGFTISVFPSIEIGLIYYFYNKLDQFKVWVIIFLTIFLDEVNNTILGISMISIIISNLMLDFFQNWLNKKNNLYADYVLFGLYSFLVLSIKYFLINYKDKEVKEIELLLQYFITFLSYPLLRFMLDKLSNWLSNEKIDSN